MSEPPPPPPPPGKASIGSTAKILRGKANNVASLSLPPPPPPSRGGVHSSTTSIPTLNSAPPSGNFAGLEDLEMPPPLPPPPDMTVAGTILDTGSGTSTAPTTASVPPPPPPPLPPATSLPPKELMAATSLMDQDDGSPNKEAQLSSNADTFVSPPPFLPVSNFMSNKSASEVTVLADRQKQIPILLLATEKAHQVAWKNGLRLADLFQGIYHHIPQKELMNSLPPFRSISKGQAHSLSALSLIFREADNLGPVSADFAQEWLQENARLQPQDGNLEQELTLLEDRVDELLQPNNKDEGSNQERLQPQHEFTSSSSASQVMTQRAYQLTSPLHLPWLQRYRAALDITTGQLDHDLTACPALVMLVCTTSEVEPPQDVLWELSRSVSEYWPTPYRKGWYDPSTVRQEVLVFHDASSANGTTAPGPELSDLLQRTFGRNAQVMTVNSVPPATAKELKLQETMDWWGGHGSLGTLWSVQDRALCRRYIQQIIGSALLPALERRIADLNAVVNERKKGVRNVLKSFWRKPASERNQDPDKAASPSTYDGASTTTSSISNTDDPNDHRFGTVKYRFDTIESQTRLLADTLFVLGDFEAALSTYRLIRDDYKADKAMVHYGNVHEMMALCLYETDPYHRQKDIFTHFETALFSYTRAAEEERLAQQKLQAPSRPHAAPHATRLATRLCLTLAAVMTLDEDYASSSPSSGLLTSSASSALASEGRDLEMADLLASASSHETALGAAVLLEQASVFYHRAGMVRKYAFHMLMAGHMFRSTNNHHEHAFRCFTCALYVYHHISYGPWPALQAHLQSALAAQLYQMQRWAVSLQVYVTLVGTRQGGHVSAKSQSKFLQHIVNICQDYPKPALACADRLQGPRAGPRVLERIVQVIRYSPGASRVLELPHIALPHIFDDSVRLWSSAESSYDGGSESDGHVGSSLSYLGLEGAGDPLVWKQLERLGKAEQNASAKLYSTSAPSQTGNSSVGHDDPMHVALAQVPDPDIRRVLAQVDKDEQQEQLRLKRKKPPAIPETRAIKEPLWVTFTARNPLGVPLEMDQIQLVARLRHRSGRVCTNEDAISIKSAKFTESDVAQKISFTRGGDFQIADFCRTSKTAVPESSGDVQKIAWVPAVLSRQTAEEQPTGFFVVSVPPKIVLDPEAEKRLTVGICPLLPGHLEILGVRYRVLNAVWAYHPFCLKGPLLKDTRAHLEQRARGPSVELQANVDREMPLLQAEFLPAEEDAASSGVGDANALPLLEGQLCPFRLRLSNVGTAPAGNISLKTNRPWIHMKTASRDSSVSSDGDATSCCIGPTGTLLTLSLEGCSNLTRPGVCLMPGEAVELPLWLRPARTGKQDLYFLYRYELYEENKDPASLESTDATPFRLLRKMVQASVYPSISVSATVAPSSSSACESVLSVEVTNHRTDQPTDLEVYLDHVALVSRDHRLEAFPGQWALPSPPPGEERIPVSPFTLGWQERASIHFRVIQNSSVPDVSDLEVWSESDFSLNEGATGGTSEKRKDELAFLCLEDAWVRFWKWYRSHKLALSRLEDDENNHPRSISSIRRANTTMSSDSTSIEENDDDESKSAKKKGAHPTSIARLDLTSDNVALICSWNARVGSQSYPIRGTQMVRPLSLLTSMKNGCPLIVTAKHASTVAHDFSKVGNGGAVVPWTVRAHHPMSAGTSRSDSPWKGRLEILEEENGDGLWEASGPQGVSFSIPMGASQEWRWEAWFPNPGVYNLQRLKLELQMNRETSSNKTAMDEDDNEVWETFSFSEDPWLVQVIDSSDSS